MTEFAEERLRIMSLARPNTGRDLLGMKIDIEHYLIEGGVAASCQTEATGNPECMLYVTGESPEPVEVVAPKLEESFTNDIRYGGDTTYQMDCSEDTVVLDFATCASSHMMVTGCIAITCSRP